MAEDLGRLGRDRGRDHHLGEDAAIASAVARVERLVQRHDPAEGRGAVAVIGRAIGLDQRRAPRDPAGVGVLDDRAGRPVGGVELGDELEGGVGVGDVVVAQRLALQLLRRGDPGPPRAVAVERRRLVRVLAVAHGLRQPPGQHPPPRRRLADRRREPPRDRRVIGRGAREGGQRQAPGGRRPSSPPVRVELGQQRRVVLHIGHHRDIGVVLRRRPQHRRPADVDILHAGGIVRARRHRRLERIEVDHHEVDRADPVLVERRLVRRVVAQRQEARHARSGAASSPGRRASRGTRSGPPRPAPAARRRAARPRCLRWRSARPPARPARAASSTRPVLSETDSSARRIGTSFSGIRALLEGGGQTWARSAGRSSQTSRGASTNAHKGPVHLAEIIDNLGAHHHLFRRARRCRLGVEIDAHLQLQHAAGGPERPDLARRQGQLDELPRRVDIGLDLGVQVEPRGEHRRADPGPRARRSKGRGRGASVT